MNIKNKNFLSAELVYIGGIGFLFEINSNIKYNLMSPDVLAFFDGVPESEEVTKDCAFPLAKPNTNLRQSIFQNMGFDWVICSDGFFRKCPKVSCIVESETGTHSSVFHIDRSITGNINAGIISQ